VLFSAGAVHGAVPHRAGARAAGALCQR